MKTVTLDETTYRVREPNDLSGSELNKLAGLLEKILTAEARALEEPVTAFMKILLPDLTEAELSSDKKTCAMLFRKTYQEFLGGSVNSRSN
jgi:hypothetical protein